MIDYITAKDLNRYNNIKIKINSNMSKIVPNEWKDKDSILFKGYNLFQKFMIMIVKIEKDRK